MTDLELNTMPAVYVLFVVIVTLSLAGAEPGVLNLSSEAVQSIDYRSSSAAPPMSQREITQVVDRHNELRVGEGAADMELMTWNSELASLAATYAAGCKWEHGQPPLGPNPQYTVIGQNLYSKTHGSVSALRALQLWFNEKEYFDYDTLACVDGKKCGHYTQVVWATSRHLGCAYHYCRPLEGKRRNSWFVVCYYGPAGNNQGQKPYIKGEACSKCGSGAGWCKDKLCNTECSGPGENCSCAAVCFNSATLDPITCRCLCDIGWHGVDCSERCMDKDERCNGNVGWSPSDCDNSTVRRLCSAMCNLCTPKANAEPDLCPPVHASVSWPSTSDAPSTQSETTTSDRPTSDALDPSGPQDSRGSSASPAPVDSSDEYKPGVDSASTQSEIPTSDRSSAAAPMSQREISQVVDRHNELRAGEGAANMELMTWNSELASLAATYAAGCKWEHGQPPLGANPQYTVIGQNLYSKTHGSVSALRALQLWFNEKEYFEYDTLGCADGKKCGHYTQVVWATSRHLGCAYHYCRPLEGTERNSWFIVCYYGPAGNNQGQKPYIKGEACSKCGSGAGWCKDNLCNSECSVLGENCSCAAVCFNSATMDPITCRCLCDVGWHGVDCSERCMDKDERCNGSADWSPSDCDKSAVRRLCPAMCNLCTPDANAEPDLCPPDNASVSRPSTSDAPSTESETVTSDRPTSDALDPSGPQDSRGLSVSPDPVDSPDEYQPGVASASTQSEKPISDRPTSDPPDVNQSPAAVQSFDYRSSAAPMFQQVFVDRHNELRAGEGAADMELMTWNTELASFAATWAARCQWAVGQPPLGPNPKYTVIAQNVYANAEVTFMGNESATLNRALWIWFKEKKHFTYDTVSCKADKMCTHYTRAVWSRSRHLGCAYHYCRPLAGFKGRDAWFVVCYYAPTGDYEGQKPYIKGAACSKCGSGAGWCKDKLCNSECSGPGENCSCAAVCFNCATLDPITCRCKCADGWHGVDCSERCMDKDERCNGNVGWSPSDCDNSTVRSLCPAMCNLCTPKANGEPDLCPPVNVSVSRPSTPDPLEPLDLQDSGSSSALSDPVELSDLQDPGGSSASSDPVDSPDEFTPGGDSASTQSERPSSDGSTSYSVDPSSTKDPASSSGSDDDDASASSSGRKSKDVSQLAMYLLLLVAVGISNTAEL